MKHSLLTVTLALALTVVGQPLFSILSTTAAAQPSPAKQKVVVHFSQSEGENALHSALMGLGIATGLQRMGASVTVMLDSEAPSLAKKEWADKTLVSHSKDEGTANHPKRTLGIAFKQLLDAGGKVVMCPHFAASCGCTTDSLISGSNLAQEGELARIIFDADKVLDY